jgi:hypothetical protein
MGGPTKTYWAVVAVLVITVIGEEARRRPLSTEMVLLGMLIGMLGAMFMDPLNWLFAFCIYAAGFAGWRWWPILPATLAYAAVGVLIGWRRWFELDGNEWWTWPVQSLPA